MRTISVVVALALTFGCGSSSDQTGGSGAKGSGGSSASGGSSSGGKGGASTGGTSTGGAGTGGVAGASSGGTGAGGTTALCNGSGPTGNSPYKNVYYGDLHLHTSYSLDSYAFGNRNDPSTAYLFAKGLVAIDIGSGTEPTSTAPLGPTGVKQSRPLDFLAVTDHSEWLDLTRGCVFDPSSPYYADSTCALIRSENPTDQTSVFASMWSSSQKICGALDDSPACVAEKKSAWAALQTAAKAAYEPCKFTSLVAYEWTGSVQHTYTEGGQPVTKGVTNHRNVIFADENVPEIPLNSVAYTTPPDLWTGLEKACTQNPATPSCDVVTIPHNTNLSAGVSLDVSGLTPEIVAQHQRFQVSAEIYQHKGASECFYDPTQPASDPECAFEFDKNAPDIQPMSFVRQGLEAGIGYAASHPGQPNPLELGFVGATDDHNGMPGHVQEDEHVGHAGRYDDGPGRRINGSIYNGPGAITGVWAEENSRAFIFAAIKRRETFATSGPRIRVRFYQTSDANACADADFPKKIVDTKTAVPMGGSFKAVDTAGGSAQFVISAWPDALSQNLADGTTGVAELSTVQVIKAHVKKAASTVIEDAPVSVSGIPGTGGCAVFTDTKFDANEYAVYYVRVLQVPTWRWSHYDCQTLKQIFPNQWQTLYPRCVAGGIADVSVKERAWTSPIWFVPA